MVAHERETRDGHYSYRAQPPFEALQPLESSNMAVCTSIHLHRKSVQFLQCTVVVNVPLHTRSSQAHASSQCQRLAAVQLICILLCLICQGFACKVEQQPTRSAPSGPRGWWTTCSASSRWALPPPAAGANPFETTAAAAMDWDSDAVYHDARSDMDSQPRHAESGSAFLGRRVYDMCTPCRVMTWQSVHALLITEAGSHVQPESRTRVSGVCHMNLSSSPQRLESAVSGCPASHRAQ